MSQKQLSDQHHRIPLKHFYSDVNLHKVSATPDCFKKVHVETRRNKGEPEDLPLFLGEETSNLTVGVRVRPLLTREQNDASVANVVSVDGNEVKVMNESGMAYTFIYDYCFWSCDSEYPRFASQDMVFTTMVQPLIDKAFLGYNACLLAYGQTGSGKSYSMMGIDIDVDNSIGKEAGIIPRFCHELFERIASLDDSDVRAGKFMSSNAKVEVSYFEIYNEKIHDLLAGSYDGGKRTPLKVREHPVFGPYVVDLSVRGVTSYEDVKDWLTTGNNQRATATTGMNEKSSRSHSIFSIALTQTEEDTMEGRHHHKHCRHSKINLVDLAGSERLSHTCSSGDRLREGVSINRSLLTLGKVITALAENGSGKKKSFVPYRDSILTWLLRESLGGNSRIMMLATISPANIHLEETLATLRFACQAGTIVNRVCINEDPQGRLIRELQAEIERLCAERQMKMGVPRRLLQSDKSVANDSDGKIETLKEQLREAEELAQDKKSWTECLEEAGKQKSAEVNYFQRCGLALQFDWKQHSPCLVNLTADLSLTGTLLYLLPAGVVRIGRSGVTTEDQQPDIALSGPLVQSHHCTIENMDSKLTLIPGCDGETFVNGELAKERTGLRHGDRVVIGRDHYFRVSNPFESSTTTAEQLADYEFACQEILRIQEEKHHAEMDEVKRQAIQQIEEAKKEAEREMGFQQMNYEQQLKQMGITLEEQRCALADVQSKKDELERKKKMLETVVQKRNTLQETAIDFIVTPYNSNFLQEVEAALNETVLESGSTLKQGTRLCNSCGCIGLHELTVAVQEANQHCKELGINFEFCQQHIIGASGPEPAVRVRDTHKHMAAFWKPAHFMEWLCHLRDYESTDNLNELLDIDLSWQDDYWNGNREGAAAHNSSQVSVSLHQSKQELEDRIQHMSMELPSRNDCALESSQNSFSLLDKTDTADGTKYIHHISNCLEQMETLANRLRKLCKNRTEPQGVNETLDSLHRNIIQRLRFVLGISHDHEVSFSHQCDSSKNSPELSGNSPQKRYFVNPPSHDLPRKSNLRSPCSTPSARTQKAVRFFLTTSQEDQSCE
jgi:kinesin family protein 14